MKTIPEKKLDEVVSRLVKTFSPEKVILFGSHAWGNPHTDSDIDLLVVLKNDDTPPTRRAAKAYRSLRGLALPVEIIVSTIEELKRNLSVPTSLTRKIFEQGKVLYG